MKIQQSTCDRCGKIIYYGNKIVLITLKVQQKELSPGGNIDSVQTLTYCDTCGSLIDKDILKMIVKIVPGVRPKKN
jgi:hypothetical protein